MSCKIIYNNQTFEIEKFKEYLSDNKNLFLQDFISSDIEGFKKFVEQPINKEIKPNESLTPKDFTNHSGGAYGGDTFWDIIGRTFGFTNNKHYRDAGNTSLSKQLRDRGIKAEVLSKEQMDKARLEVENLLGKKYPDTLQGNLQVRNYYQVANSDGVFAIAKLDTDKGFKSTSVLGGTNTAVQLGIKLNKPVYVWDIFSEKWYKFDTNLNQFEPTETPILTKNFAGVGSRNIENYQVKNKETDKWESRKEYVGKEKEEKAKQAIRDVYQNTLNQFVEQPINKEIKPNEVKGENITSKGSEFAKKLTNVGNLVGLIYKGKEYVNSEHAYQTWKSGEFNQAGYNLKGGKVRGGKIGDTFFIMTDILTEKLKQHPDLVQGINERGGLEYLQKSTHNVIGDKFWESTGQNKFIEALTQAYKNSTQPTEIKPKIEVVNRYSDSEVKANPDKIYVFGDNTDRKGTGGQAAIRNNPNAFGIATKVHPTNNENAFMSDKDLESNKKTIDFDIQKILDQNKPLVFPKDGFGTGLAKLKEKAPQTYQYLKEQLLEKFGFNNDTGELTQEQPIVEETKEELPGLDNLPDPQCK